jgi:hypothetical protein
MTHPHRAAPVGSHRGDVMIAPKCTGKWSVQVGKGDKGSFTERYCLDSENQAWFYYASINIGNGYKKRLVAPEGGIVARSYS